MTKKEENKKDRELLKKVEDKLDEENMRILDPTNMRVGWIMPSGKIYDFGSQVMHLEYTQMLDELDHHAVPEFGTGIIRVRGEMLMGQIMMSFAIGFLNIEIHKKPTPKQLASLMLIEQKRGINWEIKDWGTAKDDGDGSKRKFIKALHKCYNL